METIMIGTAMGCRGEQGAGRQEWVADRDGGAVRKRGMEMEKVSRIVTSGVTVWLAILAGMTVFL